MSDEHGGPQATPRGEDDLGHSPDQRPAGGVGGTPRGENNGLAIAAIVFGVGAVFFVPIVLGPIGIILGVMARNRAQPLAMIGLIVAIVGTVVGLVIGFIAATMVVENGVPEALGTLAAE